MKVCIINTFDIIGGAAKAAFRLNKGLNLIGVNSKMLAKYKQSDDTNVIHIKTQLSDNDQIEQEIINKIQLDYINNNRSNLSNIKFSFPYPGISLKNHPYILEADIINIHWIADFLSVESIEELLDLNKPVVWTMHDQWPFTGGCHYSAGCDKYKSDCIDCPQLIEDRFNITSIILRNKINRLQKSNLSIVTPSSWLAGIANESILLKNHDITVIPNGIEDNIYTPMDKTEAKSELGIPSEITTMYFGAHNAKTSTKGFPYLVEAINHCLNNTQFKKMVDQNQVMAIFAGVQNEEFEKIMIPYKAFGFIGSDNMLAKIYNAADFLVLPSLEDNLPNLMLEAFACETPVLAFNTGGMPEFIDNDRTGKIVPYKNSEAFGEAILEMTFNVDKRILMGKNCREKIINGYTIQQQAKNYNSLFKDLILTKNDKSISPLIIDDNNPYSDTSTYSSCRKIDNNIFPLYRKYAKEVIKSKNRKINKKN